MNFESDYNQIYNYTMSPIYNIGNILSNTDISVEKFLSNYETYIFDISLYLLRWSVYYLFFMIMFEFISKVLDNISVHSLVTKKYILKCNKLKENISELEKNYSNDHSSLLKIKKEWGTLQQTNLELSKTINVYMEKIIGKPKVMRQSAIKSSRKIKALINDKLV